MVQLSPSLLPADLKNFKGFGDLHLNHLRQAVRPPPRVWAQGTGGSGERKLSCHWPLIMHDCRVKAGGENPFVSQTALLQAYLWVLWINREKSVLIYWSHTLEKRLYIAQDKRPTDWSKKQNWFTIFRIFFYIFFFCNWCFPFICMSLIYRCENKTFTPNYITERSRGTRTQRPSVT